MFKARHPDIGASPPLLIAGALVALGLVPSTAPDATGATAPVGQGFTVTPGDLSFILKQIKIAERALRSGQDVVPFWG